MRIKICKKKMLSSLNSKKKKEFNLKYNLRIFILDNKLVWSTQQ